MTDWPKPSWQSLPLRCGTCGHLWRDWIPNGTTLAVACAVMNALRCPECYGDKLLIRTGKVEVEEVNRG